jgi:transposase
MAKGRKAGLRLETAVRDQVGFEVASLDELLPKEHRAREVWNYVEGLDLSEFYDKVRSVVGGPGRPGVDPAVVTALWLYATLEGVGSARLLERLCERDIAYRWICGRVGFNRDLLATFRREAGPMLDRLLTDAMASLIKAGIVDIEVLAVDGLRVRAGAGSNSFRSAGKLRDLVAATATRVAQLKSELEADPAASERRRAAAMLRHAEERQARLLAAQKAAAEIEAEREAEARRQRRKQRRKRSTPRASTTDPEARVLKMADGGYRPAFNAQLKSEPRHGFVVGVTLGNNSSDGGQIGAALADLEGRYGTRPKQVLVDGGYATKDEIENLAAAEIEVFSPVFGSRGRRVPAAPQPEDGPGVRAWRERMAGESGWSTYQQRCRAERPHADMRNRGLHQFLVRGMKKALAVVLWHVHAHNFLHVVRLRRLGVIAA